MFASSIESDFSYFLWRALQGDFLKRVNYLDRLLNLALRGMTLAAKFLLILFLARFLEPSELGLYGLLVAAIGYALYMLGLDFYTYTTRELLKHDRAQWGGMLKSQVALTLVLYCVCLPLLLLVFVAGSLPWWVAGWFFALLILEHLNQEASRLLIAVSDPLFASMALFLRQGAWVLVLVPVMYFEPLLRNLVMVLGAWTIGGLMALSVAAWRLAMMRAGGWWLPVDWRWIWVGVRVALPLLVATLAVRALFTFDRYWLESLAGLDVLGAYVLFISIATAMGAFLEAGIFVFAYPGLIAAFQRDEPALFMQGMRRLFIQTSVLIVGFSMLALLLINPLLNWLDRPLYHQHVGIFPWVLLAMALYNLSMIPHYGLYAQRQDRPIIQSHIVALPVFLLATWLLIVHWSNLAVPIGLCVAFSLMLVWKTVAYIRLTPVRYRHSSPASGV